MTLLTIDDPVPPQPHGGLGAHPFLALGFRPFYLLGAAFAGVAAPAWTASYLGWQGMPRLDLLWHMHEMLFGFVIAIVIGFLYTAGRNWTGLWTPRGLPLAALVALWLAGRAAMALLPALPAAAVDVLFLPLAGLPLYRVIRRSGNTRNLVMVVLLAVLAAANAAYHASVLGLLPLSPMQPLYAAIVAVVVIESVLGGRVIPNFTANAVRGVRTRSDPRLEKLSLALTALTGLAWAALPLSLPLALLALAAAVVQLLRMALWKPLCTLRQPLLWILHLSYAWIPLGFVLLALACFGLVPQSAAVHALTVGAMGGLIIGMITRTALGHTGRMLRAGRPETAMYLLLQAGVLARLVAAFSDGPLRTAGLVAATLCWSLAFGLYCLQYGPYLFRSRVDGREG
ncbi:NnrS family protein [Massilia sp. MS-15]|uniref:NnrS family protein n=1 Tax=Massilia sp. MS-15 TaxID=2878200 RepID=UPI001CD3E654|nr:NnrS family protein [Massilia sp. MS-15]MCA1246100.1 NnrS family protein [Massilia sp. MS-15]